MPKATVAAPVKRVRLTLAQLSSYDDILTDALVDNAYYWNSIRKCKDKYTPCRKFRKDDIRDILFEEVVSQGDTKRAEQRLLQLSGFNAFARRLKEVEREHFRRHMQKYINIWQPDCPWEVGTTNRYTILTYEAAAYARRNIRKNEVIKYLCGTLVIMTPEEEADHDIKKKDFSIVRSSRKKASALFLGPARFSNHDCNANATLSTVGSDGMQVRAVRDIALGEEITVTYGDNYFGDDNCECLCHTCEQFARNGWAPRRRLLAVPDSSTNPDPSTEPSAEPSFSRAPSSTGSKRRRGESVSAVSYQSFVLPSEPEALLSRKRRKLSVTSAGAATIAPGRTFSRPQSSKGRRTVSRTPSAMPSVANGGGEEEDGSKMENQRGLMQLPGEEEQSLPPPQPAEKHSKETESMAESMDVEAAAVDLEKPGGNSEALMGIDSNTTTNEPQLSDPQTPKQQPLFAATMIACLSNLDCRLPDSSPSREASIYNKPHDSHTHTAVPAYLQEQADMSRIPSSITSKRSDEEVDLIWDPSESLPEQADTGTPSSMRTDRVSSPDTYQIRKYDMSLTTPESERFAGSWGLSSSPSLAQTAEQPEETPNWFAELGRAKRFDGRYEANIVQRKDVPGNLAANPALPIAGEDVEAALLLPLVHSLSPQSRAASNPLLSSISPKPQSTERKPEVLSLKAAVDEAVERKDAEAMEAESRIESRAVTATDEEREAPMTVIDNTQGQQETLRSQSLTRVDREQLQSLESNLQIKDGESDSELSDLASDEEFDDVNRVLRKRGIRTRSKAKKAGPPMLIPSIEEPHDGGGTNSGRRPGDYVRTKELLVHPGSIWADCHTCNGTWVQPDSHETHRECPRCERHSIIFGYTWPKTEQKPGDAARVSDHRTVNRILRREEQRFLNRRGRGLGFSPMSSVSRRTTPMQQQQEMDEFEDEDDEEEEEPKVKERKRPTPLRRARNTSSSRRRSSSNNANSSRRRRVGRPSRG